ncbi:hypothetical protein VTK73DRAFT_6730 [Phialemonium thermophilum]|uniref:Uncharacterized protein n=1 Tax=Phialemonium thermophilum TaxID=223376 RepID=A0ABR3WIH1_9PEZI
MRSFLQAPNISSSKDKHYRRDGDGNRHSRQSRPERRHQSESIADESGASSSRRVKDNSTRAKTAATPSAAGVDFLFVVNWLNADQSVFDNDLPLEKDQWANPLPYSLPSYYGPETVGPVYRYRDGDVTLAHDYSWIRPRPHAPGCICRVDDRGGVVPAVAYKTYSVFRCWRFLPFVWVPSDITVVEETSAMTTGDGSSSSAGYNNNNDDDIGFRPLRFSDGYQRYGDALCSEPSISKIGFPGCLHVMGRGPSWMPSLVPASFSNPEASAPSSRGLTGELPVILGLMALSQWDRFDPVAQWRRGHWLGAPRYDLENVPGPDEIPRGVLVQVCWDRDVGSAESIYDFEEWSVVVRETAGSGRH